MPSPLRFIGIAMLIGAAIEGSFMLLPVMLKKRRCTEETDAVCVGVRHETYHNRQDGQDHDRYVIEWEYWYDSQMYRSNETRRVPVEEGTHRTIRLDPKRPEQFVSGDDPAFAMMAFSVGMLGVIGAAMVAVSLLNGG